MGWFKDRKERKEQAAKQAEIDERNKRLASKLNDDPYLGSKQKEINANKQRIAQSQEKLKDYINEELRELQRLCNAHFDNEATVERIRKLINRLNQTELGMNAGTTETISKFIVKSIGQAKNKALAENRAAVDQILGDLNALIGDMGNENTKKFYENEGYVDAKLDILDQTWQMKDLDTRQREMTEEIKQTAMEIKADPSYMLADQWRQAQEDYALNMQKIAEARKQIQARINMQRADMAQIEKTLRTQSIRTDEERMRAHNENMKMKEKMEDVSIDIAEATEEMNQDNSHVATSSMGMQDLGVSNQKVNADDIDAFLANLG